MNIKIVNKILEINLLMLLFVISLFILKNSIIEKIPKIIRKNKKKELLIKIRNNKTNKEIEVNNLFFKSLKIIWHQSFFLYF